MTETMTETMLQALGFIAKRNTRGRTGADAGEVDVTFNRLTVGALVERGLVEVRKRERGTYYALTPAGRREFAAI